MLPACGPHSGMRMGYLHPAQLLQDRSPKKGDKARRHKKHKPAQEEDPEAAGPSKKVRGGV